MSIAAILFVHPDGFRPYNMFDTAESDYSIILYNCAVINQVSILRFRSVHIMDKTLNRELLRRSRTPWGRLYNLWHSLWDMDIRGFNQENRMRWGHFLKELGAGVWRLMVNFWMVYMNIYVTIRTGAVGTDYACGACGMPHGWFRGVLNKAFGGAGSWGCFWWPDYP